MIVSEREARLFLAALEVGVLRERMGDEWTGVNLVDTLERLGVRTLGELASLPSDAVADRFGEPGLRALGMARGAEEPLRPRQPRAELREEIELHDAATAGQLDRALELLVDRLLANPLRRGRSFRRLRIEARLAGGGGWRIEAPTRQATASRERLLLVLKPKLEALPAPAHEAGASRPGAGRGSPAPADASGRRERGAPRPGRRGGAPRARRCRPGRGPARAGGGSGRRRARALGDAHAVPGGRSDSETGSAMTVLLYAPKPARVRVDERGRPVAAEGAAVEAVREEWLVEDRWWTPEPIRRHYFELALSRRALRGRLPRREGLVPPAGMSETVPKPACPRG